MPRREDTRKDEAAAQKAPAQKAPQRWRAATSSALKWPAHKWRALKPSHRRWVAVSGGVVTLALLAGVATALWVTRERDPKTSALSFARAIQSNDMAAARAASTGNEEQYKTIAAMSQVFSAFKQYEAAVVAKFGGGGRAREIAMPDVVAETKASNVLLVGDTATLVNPKKPADKHPMKLVKKDGRWYVDLASLPVDAQTKAMSSSAPRMRKAIEDTAAEIRAGKFKTPQEAQAALGARMQAAMKG